MHKNFFLLSQYRIRVGREGEGEEEKFSCNHFNEFNFILLRRRRRRRAALCARRECVYVCECAGLMCHQHNSFMLRMNARKCVTELGCKQA